MFESDDFDQILSQFDYPDLVSNLKTNEKTNDPKLNNPKQLQITQSITELEACNNVSNIASINNINICTKIDNVLKSPNANKRKIINSYFDHQVKRRFPGPAGILSESLIEPKDESICQLELLSQDINLTQNNLQKELFESPLWSRLQNDIKEWNIHDVNSIKQIKQHAVNGNLRRRKAQAVAAFVEAVDRSVIDPLVILRDATGSIKCTLHRDVWSTFSTFIVSEFCALVLWKPTVLTTGSAFKKHYLNITQNNILGIYSSVLLRDVNNIESSIPDGYTVVCDENYSVIRAKNILDNKDINSELNSSDVADNIFDDLDILFSEEML